MRDAVVRPQQRLDREGAVSVDDRAPHVSRRQPLCALAWTSCLRLTLDNMSSDRTTEMQRGDSVLLLKRLKCPDISSTERAEDGKCDQHPPEAGAFGGACRDSR